MNLHAIVREAIGDRVGLIAPWGNGGADALYRAEIGEELPLAAQHMLWNEHGRFYATGGNVKVHRAWKVIRNPDTPEARRIEEIYGRPVVAAYVARDDCHLDQLAIVNMDFGKDGPD